MDGTRSMRSLRFVTKRATALATGPNRALCPTSKVSDLSGSRSGEGTSTPKSNGPRLPMSLTFGARKPLLTDATRCCPSASRKSAEALPTSARGRTSIGPTTGSSAAIA